MPPRVSLDPAIWAGTMMPPLRLSKNAQPMPFSSHGHRRRHPVLPIGACPHRS
jgi:hypothetical protein